MEQAGTTIIPPAPPVASQTPADLNGLQLGVMGQVLDSMNTAACLIDAAEKIVGWNRRYVEFFPEHQGLLRPGWDYVDNMVNYFRHNSLQNSDEAFQEVVTAAIQRHRTMKAPSLFQKKDGRWLMSRIYWFGDGSCLKTWADVSAEHAPQNGDLPIEATEYGVCRFTVTGAFNRANRRMGDLFPRAVDLFHPRATLHDHLRRLAATIFAESEQDKLSELLARPMPLTQALAQPLLLRRRDGGWLQMEERLRYDGGLDVLWLDVSATKSLEAANTELHRLVEQLTSAEHAASEARYAMENAYRAKSDFIATVSHEIRTPINGILGLSRLLLDSDIAAEPRGWAQMIQTSANGLLDIVNDILDMSKLEAGRVELDESPYAPQELIDTILATLRPKAQEKGLQLSGSVSPSVPPMLRGDVRRLGQILFNLVGNAIKFTERGRVVVEISSLGTLAARNRKICLRVMDTGIGIPPDVLPTLFEKFTQADTSISRRFGGTGLGLAICRELAALMGGTISADSVPNQGSCFSVTLPLHVDFADMPANVSVVSLPEPVRTDNYRPLRASDDGRGRVLVAEDNDINRYIVVTALSKAGFHVTAVVNGVAAVDAARQQDFDLILMDMQMPEMDGPEATKLIRALPGRRGNLPIIALTANAMAGVREQCLSIGMSDYLTKPIDPRVLVDFVGHAIERWHGEADDVTIADGALSADQRPVLESAVSEELRDLLGDRGWREMVRGFAANLPQTLEQADGLLESRAYIQLGRLMHRLVSSAGALGVRQIEQSARETEEAIRQGRLEDLAERLEQLKKEAAPALLALERQSGEIARTG